MPIIRVACRIVGTVITHFRTHFAIVSWRAICKILMLEVIAFEHKNVSRWFVNWKFIFATLITIGSCVSWQTVTLSCHMVTMVWLATGWAWHTTLFTIGARSAFWEIMRQIENAYGAIFPLCQVVDSNAYCSDRSLPRILDGRHMPQSPSNMCHCLGNA